MRVTTKENIGHSVPLLNSSTCFYEPTLATLKVLQQSRDAINKLALTSITHAVQVSATCLEDGVLWHQVDLQVFKQGSDSGRLFGAERVPRMLDGLKRAPGYDALNLHSQR